MFKYCKFVIPKTNLQTTYLIYIINTWIQILQLDVLQADKVGWWPNWSMTPILMVLETEDTIRIQVIAVCKYSLPKIANRQMSRRVS